MNITPLGEVQRDADIAEWLVSEPVSVSYLGGRRVQFVLEGLEGDETPEDFSDAISNFLALSEKDRAQATPYVVQNFRRFIEAVGDEHVDFAVSSPEDIWRHVDLTAVHVCRRFYAERDVYVQITGECGWEVEHGLQIVLRRGNVLARVSDQDGHLTTADAYALPEERNTITYEG